MTKLWSVALLVFKGIVYGVTNLLPGIGGGLILIILGIYRQFVSSVGNFFLDLKNWRKHLAFLVPMMLGAAIGMVLFAKSVTYLMEQYPVISMFFFMGLVIGTIPAVLKQTPDMRLTPGRLVAMLIGVAIVVLFKFAERQSMQAGWSTNPASPGGFVYYLLSNVAAGGASVTPGMDGSYVWMLTGIYKDVMAAISSVTGLRAAFGSGGICEALASVHWAVLIATGIGAVVGIVFISKLIDVALKRWPSVTYYVILGLVIASIYGLWPSSPNAVEGSVTLWPVSATVTAREVLFLVLAFAVGLGITLFAGSREAKLKAEQEPEART
ncbi:MAG: DUF368 domain-containing protein [Chloroflexi bacterium]|nr:DUF368 domain-containing protein [Chloroflexota bacterium]